MSVNVLSGRNLAPAPLNSGICCMARSVCSCATIVTPSGNASLLPVYSIPECVLMIVLTAVSVISGSLSSIACPQPGGFELISTTPCSDVKTSECVPPPNIM